MILEQLQFMVHPSVLDDWLKFEDEVWLPWLRQQPGFVRKQIKVSGGIATNIIWWKDKTSWDQAATKTNDITAKNIQMRRLFGSRVTMLRSF